LIPETMIIFKEFTFDSAHFLPHVPADHKCRHMHGHTYIVKLYIKGTLDPVLGWVTDFADIKDAWRPLEKQLDHKVLNDIPGLENPTAENLAVWIWQHLTSSLPLLHKVVVCENQTSGVEYMGEAL